MPVEAVRRGVAGFRASPGDSTQLLTVAAALVACLQVLPARQISCTARFFLACISKPVSPVLWGSLS